MTYSDNKPENKEKSSPLNALSALSLYPNTGSDFPSENGISKYSKLKNASCIEFFFYLL